MSEASKSMRSAIEHSLEALEMIAFNNGFEAATTALDEISNQQFNDGKKILAEALSWAAKELRGENC